MKVLSDILHKAGILKEAAEAYSSGGYSVLVRNSTTQRLETLASSAFTNMYTADGSLTSNRTVTMGSFTLSFDKDIRVNGLTVGRGASSLSGNTVVGESAGPAFTTGNFNTAIGKQALLLSNTAERNTAVGYSALDRMTTGSKNTAVGMQALYEIQTGQNNTAIGYWSGRSITTGSHNTIIGANVFGLPAALSNNIILADGQGNIRIRAFDTGNVVVGGSVDAGYKLDVLGSTRIDSLVIRNLTYPTFPLTIQHIANARQIITGGYGNEFIDFGEFGNTISLKANVLYLTSPQTAIGGNILWASGSSFTQSYFLPAGTSRGVVFSANYTNSGASGTWEGNNVLSEANVLTSLADTSVTINQFVSSPTINTTGGTTILRGFYHNPTLTSTVGFSNIAFESTSGIVKVSTLAGTGSRMVVADSSGVLSTSALPTSTNIYNSDGTLTGNRTVGLGGNRLSIGTSTSGFVAGQLELGVSNAGGSFVIHNSNTLGRGSIFYGANSRYMEIGMAGTSLAFPVNGGAFIHNPYANLYFTGGGSGQPTTGDVIMTLFQSTKNVVVGGTTDAGYKLDVQGTGRFTGEAIIDEIKITRNGTSSGNYNTYIGNSSWGANTLQYNTFVGGAISVGTGNRNVGIGSAATTSGTGNVSIGHNAISSGSAIAIGSSSWALANTLVFGSHNHAIGEVYFGNGVQRSSDGTYVTGTGVSVALNVSGAFGTDQTGGNITIAGGKGTGTGTPGDVIISTATATSSGTTLQTLTQRMWIKGDNGNVGIGASPNAAYKLDVSGTSRIVGKLFASSGNTTPAFIGTQLGTANWINGTSSTWFAHIGHESPYAGFGTVSGANIESAFTWFYNGNSGNGFDVRAVDFGNDPRTGSSLFTVKQGGNVLIGTTADQGYRCQITTTSADAHLNVWGASSPSIRIDNAASGATQRFVFGLATAANNFITGAAAGDICMTTQSSSPLLFGANATEVMRITTGSNLLINKTTDGGQKLQVSGSINFASLPTSSSGLSTGDIWNDAGTLKIV